MKSGDLTEDQLRIMRTVHAIENGLVNGILMLKGGTIPIREGDVIAHELWSCARSFGSEYNSVVLNDRHRFN